MDLVILVFYAELASKTISRQGSYPVNKCHMQETNSASETRAEARTAILHCIGDKR